MFHQPSWRLYIRVLQLRRSRILERLQGSSDPIIMYRAQGALREFVIIENIPQDIESLDKTLEEGERLRLMKQGTAVE